MPSTDDIPVTAVYPQQSQSQEADELEGEGDEREDTPPAPPRRERKRIQNRSTSNGSTSLPDHDASNHSTDIPVPSLQSMLNLDGSTSDMTSLSVTQQPRPPPPFTLVLPTSRPSAASQDAPSSSSSHSRHPRPSHLLGPPSVEHETNRDSTSTITKQKQHGEASQRNLTSSASTSALNGNASQSRSAHPSLIRRATSALSSAFIGSAKQNTTTSSSTHLPVLSAEEAEEEEEDDDDDDDMNDPPAAPSGKLPNTTRRAVQRITSVQSNTSADSSKELQISLTRSSQNSQQQQRKKKNVTSTQRLSEIADEESQTKGNEGSSDEEGNEEEAFLHLESQKSSGRATKSQRITPSPDNPSPNSTTSSFYKAQNHPFDIQGLKTRPALAGGKRVSGSYSSSSINTFSQPSSKLATPEKNRPTSKVITASPRSSQYTKGKPSSRQAHAAQTGSDTDQSIEEQEEDEVEDADDENQTRVHGNQSRSAIDPDATRIGNNAMGEHEDEDDSSDSEPLPHNSLKDKERKSQPSVKFATKGPNPASEYDTRGTDLFNPVRNAASLPKGKAKARRTGRSVREERAAHSGVPSHDEDELPPPLASAIERSPSGLSTRGEAPSTEGDYEVFKRPALPRTRPVKATSISPRKAAAAAPSSGPRRSGRSAHNTSAPSLKVGDIYPLRTYRKLLDAARAFIEQGEHVANLTLSEMYLSDENKFEDTQTAEARLEQDPEAAVRTWQIFIYCRNRKLSVKPLSTRSLARRTSSMNSVTNRGFTSANASPARPGTSTSTTSRALSGTAVLGDINGQAPDAPFPPFNMPPEGIFRHAKDGNCPAQISAYIEVDPYSYSKSFWKIEQVAEHCLECMGMDMEIGKGMPDIIQARKEYFDYWSAHWDEQVKAVLGRTRNFTKRPKQKTSNGTTQSSRDFENGMNIPGDDEPDFFNGMEDREDSEDLHGDEPAHESVAHLPQRRQSKRKAAVRPNPIFHLEDDHFRPSSPELYGDVSPNKRLRTLPNGTSTARASASRAPFSTSRPKSRAGVLRAGPSKGKAPARKAVNPEEAFREEHDLHPATGIADLNLSQSIEELLDECSIHTLADLRNAIRGDNSFFQEGTDVPVEDFLSFMQNKLHNYARGHIGFQYDFNKKHGSGNAPEGEDLDIENEDEEHDTLEKDGDDKHRFVNNCITILRAGRVLTRALCAVQW